MAEKVSKTVSMVILHVGVGASVGYAFTGDWAVSGGIALVEPVAAVAAAHVHERVWQVAKQAWMRRRQMAAGGVPAAA